MDNLSQPIKRIKPAENSNILNRPIYAGHHSSSNSGSMGYDIDTTNLMKRVPMGNEIGGMNSEIGGSGQSFNSSLFGIHRSAQGGSSSSAGRDIVNLISNTHQTSNSQSFFNKSATAPNPISFSGHSTTSGQSLIQNTSMNSAFGSKQNNSFFPGTTSSSVNASTSNNMLGNGISSQCNIFNQPSQTQGSLSNTNIFRVGSTSSTPSPMFGATPGPGFLQTNNNLFSMTQQPSLGSSALNVFGVSGNTHNNQAQVNQGPTNILSNLFNSASNQQSASTGNMFSQNTSSLIGRGQSTSNIFTNAMNSTQPQQGFFGNPQQTNQGFFGAQPQTQQVPQQTTSSFSGGYSFQPNQSHMPNIFINQNQGNQVVGMRGNQFLGLQGQSQVQAQIQQQQFAMPQPPPMKQHPFNRLVDNLTFECTKFLVEQELEDKKNKEIQRAKPMGPEGYREIIKDEYERAPEAPTGLSPLSIQVYMSKLVGRKPSDSSSTPKVSPFAYKFLAEDRKRQRLAREASIQTTLTSNYTENCSSVRSSPLVKKVPEHKRTIEGHLTMSSLESPLKQQAQRSLTNPNTPDIAKNLSALSTAVDSTQTQRDTFSSDSIKHKNQKLYRKERPVTEGVEDEPEEKSFLRFKHVPVMEHALDVPEKEVSKKATEENAENEDQAYSSNTIEVIPAKLKKHTNLFVKFKVVLRDSVFRTENELALYPETKPSVYFSEFNIENVNRFQEQPIQSLSNCIIDKAISTFNQQHSQIFDSNVSHASNSKDNFWFRVKDVLSECQYIIDQDKSESIDEPSSNGLGFLGRTTSHQDLKYIRGDSLVLPIKDASICLASSWFDFSSHSSRLTCALIEQACDTDRIDTVNQSLDATLADEGDKAGMREKPVDDGGRFVTDGCDVSVCGSEAVVGEETERVVSDPDLEGLVKGMGKLAKVKRLVFKNRHGRVTFLNEIRLSEVKQIANPIELVPLKIDFDPIFIKELIESNFHEDRDLTVEIKIYNIAQKDWYNVSNSIKEKWNPVHKFSASDKNSVTFTYDLRKISAPSK